MQKAIAGEAVSAANLDLYYWLALAHEAAGAPAEALALYKKIQAEDLQFRDVNRAGASTRPLAPPAGAGASARLAGPARGTRRSHPVARRAAAPPGRRASFPGRRSAAARSARCAAARTRSTAGAWPCA